MEDMDEIRRTEDDDLQGRTGYRESKEIIATFYAESWSTRTTLPPCCCHWILEKFCLQWVECNEDD